MGGLDLKPCPFCGAETGLYALENEPSVGYEPCVLCDSCKATYTNEMAFTMQECVDAWNTRAERTCTVLYSNYDEELECFTTGLSCGCKVIGGWNFNAKYCPNCGAKVVD